MRCKPGDLAVSPNGALWLVLHAAPVGVEFKLPCGTTHVECPPAHWVIESMNTGGARVPMFGGWTRVNRYAVTGDNKLRPLRDGDGSDESLTWAPREVTA